MAGVLCCIASLLCTSVAVAMVGGVILAVFLRRGLKAAAIYAVPPAAIFLLWAATKGSGEFERSGTPREVVEFVARHLRATVDALGSGPARRRWRWPSSS